MHIGYGGRLLSPSRNFQLLTDLQFRRVQSRIRREQLGKGYSVLTSDAGRVLPGLDIVLAKWAGRRRVVVAGGGVVPGWHDDYGVVGSRLWIGGESAGGQLMAQGLVFQRQGVELGFQMLNRLGRMIRNAPHIPSQDLAFALDVVQNLFLIGGIGLIFEIPL